MIIKKISDDKLKITLDSNDLKENNIDVHSFLRNSPETQDFFWDVMQEAEKKYGFNIDESMIRVDARVSDTGIFTLTVTKSTKDFLPFDKIDNSQKKPEFKATRKIVSDTNGKYVYRFNSIDDLLKYASISEEQIESSLFVLDKKFYIVSNKHVPLLSEYSSIMQNADNTLAKLQEYGKLVYKTKAIEAIQKSL